MNPTDLKYTNQHEWVRIESDGTGTMGLSEFAAESLGDIVFLELPEVDTELAQSEELGEVESVKAVSTICAPLSGRVTARNEEVLESPEVVNESPYEAGWLVKVEPSDLSELDKLMSAEEYEIFLASEEQH